MDKQTGNQWQHGIYERVTGNVIELLERDFKPWLRLVPVDGKPEWGLSVPRIEVGLVLIKPVAVRNCWSNSYRVRS